MIALWIVLVVLFLIISILYIPVYLIFDCHEKLTVTLKVLWFRFDGAELIQRLGQQKDDKKRSSDGKENIKKQKNKKIDLLGFARFLGHIAKAITLGLQEFVSKSKVNLKELNVIIGTDDAAETALISGTVMQAANGLCAILQHYSKRCYFGNLNVSPDFTKEKSSISFHLVMTNKLVDIIGVFFRTYTRFFERKEENHARNSIKTSH